MKNPQKLPHHERTERFARSLFNREEPPVAREAMSRVTVNLPAGLLCAIDAVAAQGTGGNRSAAVVKLCEIGYGFLIEYLPEDQRTYMMELANSTPTDVGALVEGDD